jgi:hypothetical protein
MLATTTICPNCHRPQLPFPPIPPGGGGRSYRGWAAILTLIGTILLAIGFASFLQAPYSLAATWIYGSPDGAVSGQPSYFGAGGITPGVGYLIFWGGMGAALYIWAFVTYNRGRLIDKANERTLRALKQNGNQ